ncbi:MAG TPA: TPM domain-containing protein [Luteibaculaceae bacterium]|nr:TPM domain-containing protein [Luteibaculaceae bacterium]
MDTDILYTDQGKDRLRQAIERAEMHTSGEIRLHIDSFCKGEVLDRAAFVFNKLGMNKTELRNGVLFYLATKDRKFAILGDAGINEKVPANFWDDIKERVLGGFKSGNYIETLEWAIEQAGANLRHYFPRERDDQNELSDEITFE